VVRVCGVVRRVPLSNRVVLDDLLVAKQYSLFVANDLVDLSLLRSCEAIIVFVLLRGKAFLLAFHLSLVVVF
jgi:hypothetical protein